LSAKADQWRGPGNREVPRQPEAEKEGFEPGAKRLVRESGPLEGFGEPGGSPATLGGEGGIRTLEAGIFPT